MSYKVNWSYLPKQFNDKNIQDILKLLSKFVPTGDFTLGKPLKEFEEKFAQMIGAKYALGVNSGTDAIKLSLKALNVGPGDEVITTANTFIATIGAIAENYATPILVDCTDNFCMDVNQVESKITSKTKAIVPVNLAGQMADLPKLMEIAKKYDLPIVEDSCQCILGNIEGKCAGTFGITGAFSLHPLKNLNVWGDGGMIVTNDDQMYDKLSLLRNHGLRDRDTVEIMGCNSRLDTQQAVIGNWLIDQVDFITDTRIKNANFLDNSLKEIPEIIIPPRFSNRKLVYHLYMVHAKNRNKLYDFLRSEGIQVKIHYPVPVYQQPAIAKYGYKKGDFPVTDSQSNSLISLPAHEHLTQDQLQYMIDKITDFYRK